MQRQIIRPSARLMRSIYLQSPMNSTPISLSLPLSSAIAGPSRLFSTTFPTSKKAKLSAEKPSKGKVRSQDDAFESDVDTEGVLERTKGKMEKAVKYAQGLVYDGVERGRGRLSPDLLDHIRVQLPDEPSASPLNAIASVTVKQNTIFVEVWDTVAMKHVESAIHKANLPGISPQKTDQSTLKIPVSRPTVEQRSQIMRNLNTTIEGAKQQVRTARADGLKLVGGKTAQGADGVQDLANDYGKQLDDLLAQAKKEFDK